MLPISILSVGKFLPGAPMSASTLDTLYNFKPGFTFAKSGVATRWFASPSDTQGRAGAKALEDAIERAGIPAESIDLLIAACGVQEQALPSTACAIAAHSRLRTGTPAFDVNASCLSFMQALQVAGSLLTTGSYRRIAIVSVDFASRGLDFSEPEASLIFGDGAAAVIVEPSQRADQGLAAYKFATYPEGRAFCEIRAGGTRCNPRTGIEPADFLFRMDGKAVFKLASKHMEQFVDGLLRDAGATLSDVDWVVPHQASHLGIAHIVKRLGLPESRVINIYRDHGNQVAASMPTALHNLDRTHGLRPGQLVLFLGTAAGLSLGGALLRA